MAAEKPAPPLKGRTVVIVSGNAIVREAARRQVRASGGHAVSGPDVDDGGSRPSRSSLMLVPRSSGLSDSGDDMTKPRCDLAGGLFVGNRLSAVLLSPVAPYPSGLPACGRGGGAAAAWPATEYVRSRRGGFGAACIDISLRRVAGP